MEIKAGIGPAASRSSLLADLAASIVGGKDAPTG
jgi:hypothetical protein